MRDYPNLTGLTLPEAIAELRMQRLDIQAKAIIDYDLPLKDKQVRLMARVIDGMRIDTKAALLLRANLREFEREEERKASRRQEKALPRIGVSFSDVFGTTLWDACYPDRR